MKKLRIILIILGVVIVGIIAFLLIVFKKDTANPYAISVPEADVPQFTEVDPIFTHKFDGDKILPLLGSTLIDFDNDGIDEIFFGAGIDQKNALFKYKDGKFVDISKQTGIHEVSDGTTAGAVSYDLDNNGFTDLILTRPDGVWLLANDGTKFTSSRLPIEVNEKSNPVTITLGDYDKDGLVDIFLCNYLQLAKMEGQTIFTQKDYGANSILLKNKGNLQFEDVTEASGMTYTHNTFQAIFVDLDDDSWLDLAIAYDTGEARIYRNNGDGTFEVKDSPMTGRFGYPMGIGLGDYNNDGLADLFFSNTGSTVPEFMARGDLKDGQDFNKKWMLWRNDGGFKFTDVAEETKVADFEFSWGAIFQDFNLDGRQDLVVAESYVAFPPHKIFPLPCRFLIQLEDGTFGAAGEQAGVVNKHFAITPLTSDWNNDGYPDLAYANLAGPARIFLSKGGSNNAARIRIVESGTNAGTKVTVETNSGQTLTDWYVIGEGLSSDQSNVLTFGLGTEKSIKSVTVTFPDGKTETLENPDLTNIIEFGK